MASGKKWLRRGAFSAAFGVSAWLVLGACVSPSDDYNDYLSETTTMRGPVRVVSDAAAMEASLPDGSFMGDYVATCLPHITSPAHALRFQVALSFTPDPSGVGGQIATTFTPLLTTATTAGDIVGNPDTASGPVDASGRFKLDLMNIVIPASANTIQATDADFATDTYLVGTFTNESTVCAGLDGQITEPIQLSLDHCDDICIFTPVTSTSNPLPPIPMDKSAFVCAAPDC